MTSGPPSKLNDAVRNAIINLTREHKTVDEICKILGISTNTFYMWKNKNPDLNKGIIASRAVADDLVEISLLQNALGVSVKETKVFCVDGEIIEHTVDKHFAPSVSAQIFWLKNRRPEEWRERVEIVTDPDDHVIIPIKDVGSSCSKDT